MRWNIIIASAHDACLEDTLRAWHGQTFGSHRVKLFMDCACGKHDFGVPMDESKALRGLAACWNKDFNGPTVLTVGDFVPPPEFLAVVDSVFQRHPEYGLLMPSVLGQPDEVPPWVHAVHPDVVDKIGLLSTSFGAGGLGMVRDYRIRAYDAGFRPKVLRNVWFTNPNSSVMAKLDESGQYGWIEDEEAFRRAYGVPIRFTNDVELRPNPEYVDNDGNVVNKFSDFASFRTTWIPPSTLMLPLCMRGVAALRQLFLAWPLGDVERQNLRGPFMTLVHVLEIVAPADVQAVVVETSKIVSETPVEDAVAFLKMLSLFKPNAGSRQSEQEWNAVLRARERMMVAIRKYHFSED